MFYKYLVYIRQSEKNVIKSILSILVYKMRSQLRKKKKGLSFDNPRILKIAYYHQLLLFIVWKLNSQEHTLC